MANSRGDLIRENLSDHRSWKLGAMYLFAALHQGKARERIVVLPASKRANAANRRVHRSESAAVTLSPNHSLVIARRYFAPSQNERAVRIKNQLSIVESSAFTRIVAKSDDNARGFPPLRAASGYWTGNFYRLLIEPEVFFAG